MRDEVKVRGNTGAVQTVFPTRMQGLSSRAHAFSVEALVGKPCKRIKVSEEHEPSSADTSGDRSIFPGEDTFAPCCFLFEGLLCTIGGEKTENAQVSSCKVQLIFHL